jgi:protein-tyrosine kinase
MERIESAIAKARQARKVRAPAPVPRAGQLAEAGMATEPPIDSRTYAWTALMEFRPDQRHMERNRVVTQSNGAAAAPFDSMRTRLLYLMRDKGWKRVAITSPGPSCGKTTVSLNLALSLSRLPEERTILIDADLRRPALATLLGASAGHQFSEVMDGKAEAARHLLRVGPNLAIGTNRAQVPNSAELLQSPSAREALENLEKVYQPSVMIIDLPPVLVSDDAMAALSLVDCVLMVAAAEATSITEIDRCEQELASRSKVAGVILNKCRYLDKSEGYGYDYY